MGGILARLAQNRQSGLANECLSQKVVSTFWIRGVGSGAGSECRQLVFGKAHALGQGDAEPVQKCGLSGVGLRDAAQAD
jgi:hypothetical protein